MEALIPAQTAPSHTELPARVESTAKTKVKHHRRRLVVPPRPDRRLTAREAQDQEIYFVARTAIEAAKNEDPKGFEGFNKRFRIYAQFEKKRFERGEITLDEMLTSLAEYHAAFNTADAYDKTGAYNAQSIKRAYAAMALGTPEGGKENVAVVLDLDDLRGKNLHGLNKHTSADRALDAFVHFHQGKLYETFGISARMGRLNTKGDEFMIIVPNATVDEVNQFFQDIEEDRAKAMRRIEDSEQLPSKITAMRGIVAVQPGESFESAYKRSDVILMDQKAERNRLREIQANADSLQQVAINGGVDLTKEPIPTAAD